MAFRGGKMKWSLLLVVARVEVGLAGHEGFRDRQKAFVRGPVKRCAPGCGSINLPRVASVDIGPTREQQLHHRAVATPGGTVQGSRAVGPLFQGCAVVEEKSGHAQLAFAGGLVKRREFLIANRRVLQVRAVLDHRLEAADFGFFFVHDDRFRTSRHGTRRASN